MTETAGSDSLKRWGKFDQIPGRKDVRICSNGHGKVDRNQFRPVGFKEGGYAFTAEMLELATFAYIFSTVPEDPLKNRHCFHGMIRKGTSRISHRVFMR